MLTQETLTYIIGISTLVTMGITLYNSLKTPQEKMETDAKVSDEKFKNLADSVDEMKNNHLAHINDKLDKHIEKQIESEKTIASNFTKTFTLLDIIMKK